MVSLCIKSYQLFGDTLLRSLSHTWSFIKDISNIMKEILPMCDSRILHFLQKHSVSVKVLHL